MEREAHQAIVACAISIAIGVPQGKGRTLLGSCRSSQGGSRSRSPSRTWDPSHAHGAFQSTTPTAKGEREREKVELDTGRVLLERTIFSTHVKAFGAYGRAWRSVPIDAPSPSKAHAPPRHSQTSHIDRTRYRCHTTETGPAVRCAMRSLSLLLVSRSLVVQVCSYLGIGKIEERLLVGVPGIAKIVDHQVAVAQRAPNLSVVLLESNAACSRGRSGATTRGANGNRDSAPNTYMR